VVVDRWEWSASRPDRFVPGKRARGDLWMDKVGVVPEPFWTL